MRDDADQLPAGWMATDLGSVATITLGGTPSTEVRRFWGGEIPWMSSGEVHRRRIDAVDGRISEAGLASSNATLVDPPAVAVALAGQGKTRGVAALVRIRLCTNQSVALVRGHNGRLDASFLFYELDRRYEELRARSSGGGRAGLSRRVLARIPLRIPPLVEQRRIAEILDSVDEAILGTELLIAKLQQMKQGLLHDLLTVGVDENGELRDPDRHPGQFKDTRVGRIPRDWNVGTLGQWLIGRPRNGYSPTEVEEMTGWKMLGLGCLTPEGFEPRQLKNAPTSDRRLKSYALQEGDLLLSRSNTRELVGLSGVYLDIGFPCTYPDLMMRLTPSPATSSHFLELVLRSPYARRQLQGSASGTSGSMVKITGTSVVNLDIAMPQSDEQKRILSFLNVAEQRIALEIEEEAKFRGLRLGLQEDLLTGRVRVNKLVEGVVA